MQLPTLYRDKYLVAINKPSGLLVHRSPIDKHEKQFAVQLLRNQLGQKVYPVHRLDKPTSGVLLFALQPEVARKMSVMWNEVEKTYWAITRGKVSDCFIDHPITVKPDIGDKLAKSKIQAAQTRVKTLSTITLTVGFGTSASDYPNTDFSLLEAQPHTGRKHQIRKHLKHINHPIVGDTRYGRGEINRYFRDKYHVYHLLLHCKNITFQHPYNSHQITINAPFDSTWQQILIMFR
ncbi:MAG: pseudouridylate synthase [Gammaproteobacteria bacterium]|nr:MAG: pseudouridylate synthase [Gammaproteobacteria bacterium]